jgi:exopolysaccharide production protein ExoQ
MSGQTSGVMAKSRGYQQVWLGGAPNPSIFAWIVALFAIVVQEQHALSNALYDPQDNPAPALANLVSIVIASCFVYRDIAKLLARNGVIIAYISFVVISAAWSIHPDISLRRGLGFILTILVAAYLAVRFDEKDRMKLFSFFFVIPAIVSLFGMMVGYSDMVFGKNTLGKFMAIAIFVELYLLALGNWRPIWRFGLLSIYLTLLILSQSLTSWLCATIFLAGTAIYVIGKRDKLAGLIAVITFAWLLLLLQLGLWYNADLLLSFFGKDATLTGRTDIWLTTLDLIKQKPLLGWGYMATWLGTDPETAAIWEKLGWTVPNAHSAYLEVTLQLGLVGLGLLLTIIAVAWQRARACCRRGVLPLGWFSLMLIVGALFSSISEPGLGQNQEIYWLLLIVFSFSCGLHLAMDWRDGAALDHASQFLALGPVELGRLSLRPPSGSTQSRIVCRPTPPMRAPCPREPAS